MDKQKKNVDYYLDFCDKVKLPSYLKENYKKLFFVVSNINKQWDKSFSFNYQNPKIIDLISSINIYNENNKLKRNELWIDIKKQVKLLNNSIVNNLTEYTKKNKLDINNLLLLSDHLVYDNNNKLIDIFNQHDKKLNIEDRLNSIIPLYITCLQPDAVTLLKYEELVGIENKEQLKSYFHSDNDVPIKFICNYSKMIFGDFAFINS